MWVEKYRPIKVSEMVGNDEAREQFIRWLRNWKPGRKPALLLGPPGIGKTTLVHATAMEFGYRLIEFNASDVRTKEKLEKNLGPSLASQTLFGEKLLIFLDEVDGIYGRQDYGGMEFVLELIQASRHPLVLAANVEDDQRVKKLSNRCQLIMFARVPPESIQRYVSRILSKEGADLDPRVVQEAVAHAKGDIRAAINNVQSVAQLTPEIAKEALSFRDSDLTLRDAIETLLNSASAESAYGALSRCSAQPREKIRALHSSLITSSLDETTLIGALDQLSKADEVLGRIGTTQEWRLLRYFDRLLSHSLHSSVPKGVVKFTEDDWPWNLKLRIWNESRILRELAAKLAPFLHTSRKDFVAFYLPYLAVLLRYSKGEIERLLSALGLGESAAKLLQKEISRIERMVTLHSKK